MHSPRSLDEHQISRSDVLTQHFDESFLVPEVSAVSAFRYVFGKIADGYQFVYANRLGVLTYTPVQFLFVGAEFDCAASGPDDAPCVLSSSNALPSL